MNSTTARFLRNGFAFWSVLALVVLANGTLCTPLLASLISESVAQPLSSVTYLALAYPLIRLFFGYIEGPDNALPYWTLGVLWAVLSFAFEAILFVGIFRFSIAGVIEAFTLSGVLAGNLFALELVIVLVAPALFSRVARHKSLSHRGDLDVRRAPLRRNGLPAE